MGSYLEDYLEEVANVPAELQRNLALIQELDSKTQDLVHQVEVGTKRYLRSLKKSIQDSAAIDSTILEELRENQKHCLEIADEKIVVATLCYELLDKHIRKLDGDLAKFDSELQAGNKEAVRSKVAHKRKAEGAIMSSKKKAKEEPKAAHPGRPAIKREEEVAKARIIEEEVSTADPHEPRYCICDRVSFGEMVGCDNPECPREWFHYECVGLTKPPQGEWFCPDCRVARKK